MPPRSAAAKIAEAPFPAEPAEAEKPNSVPVFDAAVESTDPRRASIDSDDTGVVVAI